MKKFNKLALLICFALVITAFSAAPAMAKSKGKLVKKCHVKELSYYKGKWEPKDPEEKEYAYIFNYNKKKDLVKISKEYVYKKGKPEKVTLHSFKYKYKNRKKIRRKESVKHEGVYYIDYKNNVPVKKYDDFEIVDGGGEFGVPVGYEEFLKYKSRYLTYSKYVEYSNDEQGKLGTLVFVDRYSVKTKKGFPVKITEKGNDGLYRIKFYTKGPKRGLIKEFLMGGNGHGKRIEKFSYTVKKGVVVKAVRKEAFAGYDKDFKRDKSTGMIKYDTKKEYRFEYTKNKADNKRYCAMINDIIAGMENSVVMYYRPIYVYWY